MLLLSENSPSNNKLYNAGNSFRLVRSPEAPKIITVQGCVAVVRVVGLDGVLVEGMVGDIAISLGQVISDSADRLVFLVMRPCLPFIGFGPGTWN